VVPERRRAPENAEVSCTTTLDEIREVLTSLFVEGVLTFEATVLFHFDALAVIITILHGDVVTLFAYLALEGHLNALVILRHWSSLCPIPSANGKEVSFYSLK
jgi:hypothetical protein